MRLKPRGRSRTTMLAGWLFADLLLVLLITGLAELPAKSHATPTPHPTRTHAHTTPTSHPTTPHPTPTRSHQQGLNRKPIIFTVPLTAEDYASHPGTFLSEVNAALRQVDPTGAMIGFADIEAYEESPEQAEFATTTADAALKLVEEQSTLFANAAGLGAWNGAPEINGSPYGFMLRIFLLN